VARNLAIAGFRDPAGGDQRICQAPSRSSGMSVPSRVIPVISSSELPIMKSTWISESFIRLRSPSSATANPSPCPSAM
jgi:hypothetical protein